jgi:hypothetical protein
MTMPERHLGLDECVDNLVKEKGMTRRQAKRWLAKVLKQGKLDGFVLVPTGDGDMLRRETVPKETFTEVSEAELMKWMEPHPELEALLWCGGNIDDGIARISYVPSDFTVGELAAQAEYVCESQEMSPPIGVQVHELGKIGEPICTLIRKAGEWHQVENKRWSKKAVRSYNEALREYMKKEAN